MATCLESTREQELATTKMPREQVLATTFTARKRELATTTPPKRELAKTTPSEPRGRPREEGLATLICRMGDEDGDALEAFLESEWAGRTRRLLELRAGRASDVEDAMQEGAWKLWRAARTRPPVGVQALESWVFRIFLNAARDLGRKRQRHQDAEWTATLALGRDEALPDTGAHEVDARDTAKAVKAAIAHLLSPTEREIAFADVDAGGRGDDLLLAKRLDTTRTHVRVLRSRVRHKLFGNEGVRGLSRSWCLDSVRRTPSTGPAILS